MHGHSPRFRRPAGSPRMRLRVHMRSGRLPAHAPACAHAPCMRACALHAHAPQRSPPRMRPACACAPKIAPKTRLMTLQDRSRTPQDPPQIAPRSPKTALRWSRDRPRRPKTGSRWPRDRPRRRACAQDCRKILQEHIGIPQDTPNTLTYQLHPLRNHAANTTARTRNIPDAGAAVSARSAFQIRRPLPKARRRYLNL